MISQINSISKSGTFALRNIGRISKYLSPADHEKLVHAFITSRLDSWNSLLFGLPVTHLNKLQRLQNSAARLITRTKKDQHITPVLHSLHWLPVTSRITYKLLLITYKALNGLAPSYITELLHSYQPKRTLRSSNAQLLTVPPSRTCCYGDRAFSVCSPKLWNSLPLHVKTSGTLSIFKSRLKTFLFISYYQ